MRDIQHNELPAPSNLIGINQPLSVSPRGLVSTNNHLPKSSILEFQKIYLQIFHENLSEEVAQTKANDFLSLYDLLSQGDEYEHSNT